MKNNDFPQLVRRFAHHEGGALAIIFALSLLPLMAAGGMAVDLGRAYMVKLRLTQAVDAGGLALAAAYDTDQNLQTVLETIFAANYPGTKLGTTSTPSYSISGEVITVSANAVVPMTFMKLVGVNSVTVDATSKITRKQSTLEVALVLDNTGSMNSGGKIGQLRTSATSLVNTLFGTKNNPTNLKVGIVPFVTTVNIGTGNSAYINNLGSYNYSPDTWKGCIKERTYPHDVMDTSTGVGGLWDPYYWPKERYVTSSYNNSIFSGGKYPCANAWSSIDTTPIDTMGPNQACPDPIVPLTNNKTTLTTAISNLEPWNRNGTMINIGAVWGWRVLSSAAPFTEGAVEGTSGLTKALVIMTDGDNYITTGNTGYGNTHCNSYQVTLDGVTLPTSANPEGNGLNSSYTGYGYVYEGRLGSTYLATATANLDTRLAEVCTNIKAANIVVYTVIFGTADATTQTLMQNCASDSSKYFYSTTNAEFDRAFRKIAAELKKIYLSE